MGYRKKNDSDVVSLAEQVRQQLRADIYNMALTPGYPLIENELARRFKTSRTPVREAIKGLEAEGLAVSYPGRGSQVSDISMKDQLEALDVRELVEPYVARKAAVHCNEEAKEEIHAMLDSLAVNPEQPQDLTERIEFDLKLHDLILRVAGNETIRSIILDMHYRVRRTYPILKRYRITKEEHCLILEAILNQDEDQAETLMREHIRGIRIALIS
jgi:GntR family transcriptional regulator, rspAB operon transcriptional repressor